MLPTAARPLVRQIASALNGASSSARNGIKSKLQLGFPRAETTTASAAIESSAVDAYSKPTAWVHWLMGAGILGCFGAVQGAMWTKDTKLKGELMIIHNSTGLGVAALLLPRIALGSTGLGVAALVLPRIALAVMAKRPGGLPGSPPWEHMIAGATHYAMYAFMIAMPVSGIAMGFYGGKGMPFYGYFTIPGAEPPKEAPHHRPTPPRPQQPPIPTSPHIAVLASGIAMGHYGGKGMPFYGYFTISGAEPP
eukprot:gene359-1749_t